MGGRTASAQLLAALEAFEGRVAGKSVLCLPDLYIDHLVTLPKWGDAQKSLTSAALRGGGRVRSGDQHLVVGGNALNTARALAALGVRAQLAAWTSQAALEFARRECGQGGPDLSLVQGGGQASLTVALEMGGERTNVQLNQPGSLDGLRLKDLGESTSAALSRASAVHIANWGQNLKAGTAFVAETAKAARAGGALTFFDPSDLWGREKDTLELIRSLTASKDVDWLLVNEAELRELARVLLLNAGGTSPCAHDDLEGQAREFSKRVPGGLAVHTASRAQAWRGGKSEAAVAAPPAAPLRTTGAGDVWNAGFIAATLAGLQAQVRLEFADGLARAYVQSQGPMPTLAALKGPAPSARDG